MSFKIGSNEPQLPPRTSLTANVQQAQPTQQTQPTQQIQQPQQLQAQSSVNALTLGDIWNGIKSFFTKVFTAITSTISNWLNPKPKTPVETTPPDTSTTDYQAIAAQYGLLSTKENVEAFLAETKGYETGNVLGPGSTATEDIKELQQILKGWNYPVDVTGQFDEKTAQAVMLFKSQNGLHQNYKLANGEFAINEIVDSQTLTKIMQLVQNPTTPTTPTLPTTPTTPTVVTTPTTPTTPTLPTTPTTPTAPDPGKTNYQAIATQYGLLATQENVDAFLAEVASYEGKGVLGPESTAKEDIKELQQILAALKYPVDVNGSYDAKTSQAIVAFKQQNGLHQNYKLANGTFAINEYADQNTLAKLLAEAEKLQTPTLPTVVTTPTTPTVVTTPTTPTTPTVSTTPTAPDPGKTNYQAIATQYGLLATQENVDAFLAEVSTYEGKGVLGPESTAKEDIKELQQILAALKYPVDVNGSYDAKTTQAIVAFKQQNGLHQNYKLANGTFAINEYADQNTLVKLLAEAERLASQPTTPTTPTTATTPTVVTTPTAPTISTTPTVPTTPKTPTGEPDLRAIAQQYNLLGNVDNVQAFLEEMDSYAKNGALGPESTSTEDIKELQTVLKALGFSVDATGSYDSRTSQAVIAFKKQQGIQQNYKLSNYEYAVNEYADPNTINALMAAYQKVAPAQPNTPTVATTPTAPTAATMPSTPTTATAPTLPSANAEPDLRAIAQQYNLLGNVDNVQAFLEEMASYEKNGVIGPESTNRDQILELQQVLQALGYSVDANGSFDAKTSRAVVQFKQQQGIQQSYRLSNYEYAVNEYVDPNTVDALRTAYQKVSAQPAQNPQPTQPTAQATQTTQTTQTPPAQSVPSSNAAPDLRAIAQQHNLLGNVDNVQAFLEEMDSYAKNGTLGPGSTASGDIRELQTLLAALGYSVDANGSYDSKTAQAVKSFKQQQGIQQSYKLSNYEYAVNEYADPNTINALMAAYEKRQASQPAQPTQPQQPQAQAATTQTTQTNQASGNTEFAAIASQYNLQSTQENVEAFLAEVASYEQRGVLGPGNPDTANIKQLQTALKALGFSVDETGNYDQRTSDAVTQFKKQNGLHQGYRLSNGEYAINEYADQQTLAKIMEKLG